MNWEPFFIWGGIMALCALIYMLGYWVGSFEERMCNTRERMNEWHRRFNPPPPVPHPKWLKAFTDTQDELSRQADQDIEEQPR